MAAFAAEPDNAFLLSELCERIYPRINRVEKKHRVAVARAAKLIPTLAIMKRETLGGELVIYDPLNVMSYAMARLKADAFLNCCYRNHDPRKARIRETYAWLIGRNADKYAHLANTEREVVEQELREMLVPGGTHHKYVVKGGSWWRHTEIARAKKRGDRETVQRSISNLVGGPP
jgi:hypothetical protein